MSTFVTLFSRYRLSHFLNIETSLPSAKINLSFPLFSLKSPFCRKMSSLFIDIMQNCTHFLLCEENSILVVCVHIGILLANWIWEVENKYNGLCNLIEEPKTFCASGQNFFAVFFQQFIGNIENLSTRKWLWKPHEHQKASYVILHTHARTQLVFNQFSLSNCLRAFWPKNTI